LHNEGVEIGLRNSTSSNSDASKPKGRWHMNKFIAPLFSCFVVVFGFTSLAAQESLKEFEATLVDQIGSPRVEFNLGKLNAKEKHSLKLKILNPTDYEYRISKVVMGCACGGGTLDNKILPADGSTTLSLQILPPKQVVSTEYQQGLFLFDEAGRNVEVRLRYELEGVLCFTSSMAYVDVRANDAEKRFTLPFVFSKPVSFERLTVEATGGLKELDCAIRRGNDGFFVQCQLNHRLHEKGASGSIVLMDSGLGTVAEIPCTVSRVPLAKLLPSVIRFATNDRDGVERSTAILKIDDSHLQNTSKDSNDGEVEIKVSEPSEGYSVKHHRMGKGVYRLDFIREPSKAPDSERLKLTISSAELKIVLDSAIMRD